MKLTFDGIKKIDDWKNSDIKLPVYDVGKSSRLAIDKPRWIHFGIGNIFRVFIAGIADDLLSAGLLDRGITAIETFDGEIVDKIYRPYDNLSLSVILKCDGEREQKVIGSISESIRTDTKDLDEWKRARVVFESPDLQLISLTITEKGYALYGTDGDFLPWIVSDISLGPEKPLSSAMAIITSGLYSRYLAGGLPVALVSMDNCRDNGLMMKESILTIAGEWKNLSFVDEGFISYLSSEKVAFPCTMIDKITPRPSQEISDDLKMLGVEDMDIVVTEKRTYIAPFVNAESPQYLVIEDVFPGGRPPLERGKGVYMGDFETVRKSERMKVTACLNPVHSATGPLGVLLGIEYFANMLNTEPEIMKMARMVAYDEGIPIVEDPEILSPKAFTDELFEERFPNEYLRDTNLRLSTDVSQGVGVRFGVTISAYKNKYGTAERLTAIPLGIASWLRYMMGIDDFGNEYDLAPDPMVGEFRKIYSTIEFGKPHTAKDKFRGILSNRNLFYCDLYEYGVGEKIEKMLYEMIEGKGAVRRTIQRYMA